MFRYLFIPALILLNVTAFANSKSADENFKNTIKKVAPAVAAAGTIDYKSGCATCSQIGQASKTATLYSKENNQRINLTVLSEEEASSVFNELAARGEIPYGYVWDGCYARAHKMVRIMEDQGIIAGKAILEGNFYVDTEYGEVGWGYHVAPVVLVKSRGKVQPFIFDPSLFKKPVPYETWKEKLLEKRKSFLTSEFYTNRFAYDNQDRDANYTEYQEEHLVDMNETNRNFSHKLFIYNEQLKER